MAVVKPLVKPLSISPSREKKEGDILLNDKFVESVSANKTTDGSEDIILVDASGGPVTITLGSPSAEGDGPIIKKTDSSSNAVTVDTEGSETIDGSSSVSVSTQYAKVDVVTDGSNWFGVITAGAALTAQDSATVDATYGSEESGVISNNRTRIAEIESRLEEFGIL